MSGRYAGTPAANAAIELSEDREWYRISPEVDEVDYQRWFLIEHAWRPVYPTTDLDQPLEPRCHEVDESQYVSLSLAEVIDEIEMGDIYGRRFGILAPTQTELEAMLDEYDAMARGFDPSWPSWRDAPHDQDRFRADEPLTEASVEVCDNSWTRETYAVPGPNLDDDIWDGHSRSARWEREPGFPGALTWAPHEEIAVTVTTDTDGPVQSGGTGTMVWDEFVITNAHVIGGWTFTFWNPDDGPWRVCAWGSEEWCSTVIAWTRYPGYAYAGDHYNDLAVLKLDDNPGYQGPQNDVVPFALLSTTPDTVLEGLTLNSVGYPAMVPTTSANPTQNIVTSSIPGTQEQVWSGQAYSQPGVTVIKTTANGVKMKLDAMPGQSGSPIYTHNTFNVSTVHALEAGFYNVPGSKGHRGPKISLHRDFIVLAIGSL